MDVSKGFRPKVVKNAHAIPEESQSPKSFIQLDTTGVVAQPSGLKSYSEKARQLIASKENIGCLENPDARGKIRGWCGDSMQIDLHLMGGIIKEARFMTDGCGATCACGSMITKLAMTKTLAEAEQITPEDVLTALDGLPEDHKHCAELAVNTLRQAIKNAGENRGVDK